MLRRLAPILFALVACDAIDDQQVDDRSAAPELEMTAEDDGYVGTFQKDDVFVEFEALETAFGDHEVSVELNGMTLTWSVSRELGVVDYDGFATDNGEETVLLDEDRAALAALADELDQLGPNPEEPIRLLRALANVWEEVSTTRPLRGTLVGDQSRSTSRCGDVNSYVKATHDCWETDGDCSNWWGCSNNDDNSTADGAYISMHGSCASGAMYYWSGGKWTCIGGEGPDHSSSIEYMYGNCMGRCGGGCGSGTQFTTACINHDHCVRWGHHIASPWCDDELLDPFGAAWDAVFASNC
jgi:hypothetical protein